MDEKTKQKFGIYIFVGLLIGAVLGIFFGTGSANPVLGIGTGALVGTAIGWFIGAAMIEKEKKEGK